MKSILVATIVLLPLGACVTAPNWSAIGAKAREIQSDCKVRTPGSAAAAERCAQAPIRALYANAGFPDMDIIDAYQARRLEIVTRLDAGRIGSEQANAEIAEARVSAISTLQQRRTARAQESAAIVSMIPQSITCIRSGPATTCN